MGTLSVNADNFFGLLELDAAGTVLYSRLDGEARGASNAMCGSNYYTEVAPFENVAEFRDQMGCFERGDSPAHSFTFDCRFANGGVVAVRVLLARMRQRADGSRQESTLVHIRKM